MQRRARSAPTSRIRSTPMPCTVRTRWRMPRSRSRTSSRPPTSTHAEAMQRTGDIAVKDPRTNVFDLDRVSLERFFEEELGDKKFRAHQVMKWIHHRHATGFEEMTDLGKALRARLEERDRKSTRLNSSH